MGTFFHRSKLTEDVAAKNVFVWYLNADTIRTELGTDLFDQFQQYKITGGELALFDITTPTDAAAAAGVLYIAPYPWSTFVSVTQNSFNTKTLPGCQWKAVNIPMTNFSTSNKFPVGSIGNSQMLTVPLHNPQYMMNTRDASTGSDTGQNRADRFVLTNSHSGLDKGKWYGWLMEYDRYSSSQSSIKSVSFHVMFKYHVVLSGWRPSQGKISSSRKKRDSKLPVDDFFPKSGECIHRVIDNPLIKYESDEPSEKRFKLEDTSGTDT